MNVFDIIGPVMIGPSSSHTAGAVRLGLITHCLLGKKAIEAKITLYGSFAKTYKGHGTDKALTAGIMGMETDDVNIRHAIELAKQNGLSVTLDVSENAALHPNTARICLVAEDGTSVELLGSSIGGGSIEVTEVNYMPVFLTGEQTTLIVLHQDKPGVIAQVADFLAEEGANIASFYLSRQKKGGESVMTIEVDGTVNQNLNDKINALPNVISSTLLAV
ncbi:L-serine ammonia-lyase, iron-sulfur-dependent subunit beta [Scatolibacter rhodanostii]|uniref:L-serine ammonia-lyase, iron-sulfur-dependent subunit beta n=1 Tax=Scatolibacter rhodanostii TaxID=2014781 RepID=UPI000C06E7F4|nr:L-serine ammonia-lyase, iron-sulfur-dependent subunit beta [Scatolibacter rhodanostii]